MSEFSPYVDTGKSPAEWAKNKFAGKTAEIERPQADAPEYRYTSASELRKLQVDWDEADDARVKREEWLIANRSERAAKDAEAQTARETALKAAQDAQRATALDAIKRRYLSRPGVTLADWLTEDHDALLRQDARNQALGIAPSTAPLNVAYREF